MAFAPDPPPGFWEKGFDDNRWADIRVPAHFEMDGFRSVEGVGGYRKRFRPPAGDGRLKLRFDGVEVDDTTHGLRPSDSNRVGGRRTNGTQGNRDLSNKQQTRQPGKACLCFHRIARMP